MHNSLIRITSPKQILKSIKLRKLKTKVCTNIRGSYFYLLIDFKICLRDRKPCERVVQLRRQQSLDAKAIIHAEYLILRKYLPNI